MITQKTLNDVIAQINKEFDQIKKRIAALEKQQETKKVVKRNVA